MPFPVANVLWWIVYCLIAIELQMHFPGVDAFAPGILLSCQEGKFRQTAIVCFVAILLQEGSGSLAFGNSLLWYAALLVLFFAGKGIFETGSLFFIVLLALILGCVHSGILYISSSLQEYSISSTRLVSQAMAQTLIIPPLYSIALFVRKRFMRHEYGF